MIDVISADEFKMALPTKMRGKVNQEVMDAVNAAVTDPEACEQLRENLISYNHVMKDGKFSIPEYINAVKYVSFKTQGCSNIESFIKTFPKKYAKWKFLSMDDKTISRYVTAYNKSKLVNLIFEQTLVPVHILNAEYFQKALNVQVELMMNAKSEKVRSDAATSVMQQVRPPETKKVELDIGVKEDDTLKQLRETTMELVAEQRKMLKAGAVNAQDVAHSQLVIDVTSEEV